MGRFAKTGLCIGVALVAAACGPRDEGTPPARPERGADVRAALERLAHIDMAAVAAGVEAHHQRTAALPLALDEVEIVDPLDGTVVAAPAVRDPWGSPFLYAPGEGGRYEVRSAGPDRRAGTSDDLVRSGRAAEN